MTGRYDSLTRPAARSLTLPRRLTLPASPRVPQAGGDAGDGRGEGALERGAVGLRLGRGAAQPPQQLDLDEVDRIDVRVPHVDRAAQDAVPLDERPVAGHLEDRADGLAQPGAQGRADRPERLGHERLPMLTSTSSSIGVAWWKYSGNLGSSKTTAR